MSAFYFAALAAVRIFFVPLYVDFNVLLNAEWIWRTKEYTG